MLNELQNAVIVGGLLGRTMILERYYEDEDTEEVL
ncbi:hypothetical protein COCOBI_pt-0520 (chloroplast) [Coccomyxa sp. Obi]|nr:hypothetical protein COCOBI_pt-0520 [Coccomyxa sp. Obi]